MKTAQFFTHYYNNAVLNNILIMNPQGFIIDVNQAFTNNFGYSNDDIKGLNFSILFNEEDNKQNKPMRELETVAAVGSALDENYVIDKKGTAMWAMGESLLVFGEDGEKYIVKDIVNLQGRKQVELFLMETEELLNRIFESTNDIAMLILDGSIKIIKANAPFLSLFELTENPPSGTRLSELDHPFFEDTDLRKEISSIIINDSPIRNKEFLIETKSGEIKKIKLDSRIIDRQTDAGKKIFIMINEVVE